MQACAEQPFPLAIGMTFEKLEERPQVHGNKPLPGIFAKFSGLGQPFVFTSGPAMTDLRRAEKLPAQACRSSISFLVSAMALAGLRPLGQAVTQFMIVWQR